MSASVAAAAARAFPAASYPRICCSRGCLGYAANIVAQFCTQKQTSAEQPGQVLVQYLAVVCTLGRVTTQPAGGGSHTMTHELIARPSEYMSSCRLTNED